MRRFLLLLGGLTFSAFLAAQLVRPPEPSAALDVDARTVWQDPSVPADVRAILRRSCADCHSIETRWPWYTHVAPASWLVANDVRNARARLNLSNWPRQPDIEKAGIGDVIVNRLMPPRRYLLLHPDARLSDAERKAIVNWIQNTPR